MINFKNYLIFGVILLFSCDTSKSQSIPWNRETSEWISNEVYQVDKLNYEEVNYDQFTNLMLAIADKRIVMLGEQTHGDGTTFRAKAFLVKFLHEEMGFEPKPLKGLPGQGARFYFLADPDGYLIEVVKV